MLSCLFDVLSKLVNQDSGVAKLHVISFQKKERKQTTWSVSVSTVWSFACSHLGDENVSVTFFPSDFDNLNV